MADDSSAILGAITEFLMSKNCTGTLQALQYEWATLYPEDEYSVRNNPTEKQSSLPGYLAEYLKTVFFYKKPKEDLPSSEAQSSSDEINKEEGEEQEDEEEDEYEEEEEEEDTANQEEEEEEGEEEDDEEGEEDYEDEENEEEDHVNNGVDAEDEREDGEYEGEIEEDDIQSDEDFASDEENSGNYISQPYGLEEEVVHSHKPHNPAGSHLDDNEAEYEDDNVDGDSELDGDDSFARVLVDDMNEIMEGLAVADDGEIYQEENGSESDTREVEGEEADEGENDEEGADLVERKAERGSELHASPSPSSAYSSQHSRSNSVIENVNELLVQHIQNQRDEFYEDAQSRVESVGEPTQQEIESQLKSVISQQDTTTATTTIGDGRHTLRESINQPQSQEISQQQYPKFLYPVEVDGITYDCFELKVIHVKNRTGFEETKEFPIQANAIIAARYQILEFLDSAAFSKAVRAIDLHTGNQVCIKIIKNNKDFVDQSLDEIKLLKYLNSCGDPDKFNVLRLYGGAPATRKFPFLAKIAHSSFFFKKRPHSKKNFGLFP